MNGQTVPCKHCALSYTELRQAIYVANREVLRDGTADTTRIKKLKAEVASCLQCNGTGRVPASTTRRPIRRDVRPVKVITPKPAKRRPVIGQAEIAAALDEAKALAATVAKSSPRGTRLSPTGRCHTCDRPVSGERRYCGSCAAGRR